MHGTCRLESVTTTCAQHVCALIDGIGGSVQTATTAIAVWASGLRGCHPEGWMRRDTLLGPVGSVVELRFRDLVTQVPLFDQWSRGFE